MSIVVAAWLVVLVGVTVADWDVSGMMLPFLLCSLLIGALRHTRWVRRSRGETDATSAEKALRGYPIWW